MTKKQRDRRLDSVEEQLTDAAESASGDSWSVEWRDAAPEERPEGMAVDGDSRTIYYDVWEAQAEVLDELETPEKALYAFLSGYGSGKTLFGTRYALATALNYPGTHVLIMGTSYSESRTAVYRTLYEQLPGDRTHILSSNFNGPEQSPIVSDFNRSTFSLTLCNDSIITLGSADKYNRHAGDSYGLIYMDEFSHYQTDLYDLLEMLGSRLRGQDGPLTMLTTLTGAGFNQAYDILERRETADGEELPFSLSVTRADTRDNPFLSDAALSNFEEQFADTARESQALSGGFSAAQGLVFDFSRDVHVVDAPEAAELVDETKDYLFGYDSGFRDPRVVITCGRSAYGQLVVTSEFYREASHAEDAIRYLRKQPDGTVFSEHTPEDISKMRKSGLSVMKAEKAIEPGISEVSKRLETDDEGRPGLLVSSSCQNLIREFLGYQNEHVGQPAAEDHALDSLRYLIMGAERVREHEEQSAGRGIRTFGGTSNSSSGLVDDGGRGLF